MENLGEVRKVEFFLNFRAEGWGLDLVWVNCFFYFLRWFILGKWILGYETETGNGRMYFFGGGKKREKREMV